MLRVIYEIAERYTANTSHARTNLRGLAADSDYTSNKLERMTRDAERFEAAAKRAGASVGIWARRFGMLGVAAAGWAVHQTIKDLGNLEQSIQGVAGAFMLNEAVDDFESGMRRAESVVERFRRMAVASPADYEAFLSIYQTALPSMLRANVGDDKMERMTQMLVGLRGIMPGRGYEEVAQSASMVLSGAAGQDSAVWRTLQRQLGGDVQAWNKLARERPEEAFERMLKVLNSLEPSLKAAENSMAGLLSTLGGVRKEVFQIGGAALFDEIKDDLKETVSWVDKNREQIENLARGIGRSLVDAYNSLKGPALFLATNLDKVVDISKVLFRMWAYDKLMRLATGVGAWATSVKSLGTAAATAATAATARTAAGVDIFQGTMGSRIIPRTTPRVVPTVMDPAVGTGGAFSRIGAAVPKVMIAAIAAEAAWSIGNAIGEAVAPDVVGGQKYADLHDIATGNLRGMGAHGALFAAADVDVRTAGHLADRELGRDALAIFQRATAANAYEIAQLDVFSKFHRAIKWFGVPHVSLGSGRLEEQVLEVLAKRSVSQARFQRLPSSWGLTDVKTWGDLGGWFARGFERHMETERAKRQMAGYMDLLNPGLLGSTPHPGEAHAPRRSTSAP
jgi:hypothetical protein